MKHFLQTIILIVLFIATKTEISAQKPELVTQTGHLDSIYALAISPDKKYLASAGVDKTIIIWDIAKGKQLYSLKGHSQWIFSLDFNNDGYLLASGSADGTVKIWDVVRGIKIEEISLQPFEIKCVAFSSDGNTLAVAGEDKVIKLWDVKTKKLKADLTGHDAAVSNVAFSPNNKYLVSISRDKTLRLWNLETMKVEQQVKFEPRFETLAYSLNGNFVAVAGIGEFVGFWNFKTGNLEIKPSPKEIDFVKSLAYVSDKELAIVDTGLSIWNYENGDLKKVGDSVTGSGSNALAISRDKKLLAFNDGQHIKFFDLNTKQPKEFKGGFGNIYGVTFGLNNPYLFASVNNNLGMWGNYLGVEDTEIYSMMAKIAGRNRVFIPAVNSLALVEEDESGAGLPDIVMINIADGTRRILKAHNKAIDSITINPGGDILASSSKDGTVKLWDMKNITVQTPIRILQETADFIEFSPDGRLLATVGSGWTIKLWDTVNWNYKTINNVYGRIVFSPDSKTIGVYKRDELKLIEISTLKVRSFNLDSTPRDYKTKVFNVQAITSLFTEIATILERPPLSFSQDSKLVASQEINRATGDYRIKVWNIETGEALYNLPRHSATIPSISFSPKNGVMASGSWDKSIKLWNAKEGSEIATIIPLNDKKWVIYTPDGRFDTNTDLEDDDIIHWSIPGNSLNTLPLDVFIRDYYEPKLFERLINCTEQDICKQEFRETRSLSELNIVRPNVKITDVSLPDANLEVSVTVEVSKASGLVEKGNGQQITRTTDVYDLRLFRDKQLVGNAPFDGAEKIEQRKAEIENSEWKSKFETELKVWRGSTKVKLNSQTGKQTLSFKVQLQKGKDASDVKFTAYAFNEDRVKSETAKYEWMAEQKAKLPKADSNVKRRAYIFSIGVNDSNPSTELIHAASDAFQFQNVVPEKLNQTGVYEVVPIQLITADDNGKLVVNATKQNIHTVFDLLAGKDVPLELKRKIPNYEQIKKSTPDDLIIITYSGHGYSGKNSDFHLVLSDSDGKSLQDWSNSNLLISGEELALWLRDIEMNEMVLVIDACQSASAVESLDFKPGPLGSRGFGQIAYDKRLRILVAAQADYNALESDGEIKGGLLTYVLLDEGLVAGKADSEKDGKIMLNEWLEYGESRVPSLFKEVIKKNEETLVEGRKKGLVWKTLNNNKNFNAEQQTALQRASFFNFSRQNSDIWLFNTNMNEK